MNPKVNVLILNWNGQEVLNQCIDSILKSIYNNYKITVIDNNSTDNSLKNIIINDKISVIRINNNLGFANGYNYGFKKILNNSDEFYLILNNDTILNENSIKNLVDGAKKYGKNNIYGPKIVDHSSNNNWFCGGKINFFTAQPFHLGINESELITTYKTANVDYVSGCCMLIHKNIIKKLSGFNESFDMYYEDVDLCLRAKKINSKCFYISNSNIRHIVSFSIGGRYSYRKYYFKIKSFIKYFIIYI